jgi:hypothetical protein
LKYVTDGEARITKFTNVDASNRTYLSPTIEAMKDAECGFWKLVCAFDIADDIDKQRRQHAAMQKKKPKTERTPFIPMHEKVHPKAGYIVWKDSNVVIFYTNDLAATPSQNVVVGTDQEAIDCVSGLGTLFCWTGTEVMHCTAFLVPAFIVAYNLFMNGVDRLDQKRATNATKRRGK